MCSQFRNGSNDFMILLKKILAKISILCVGIPLYF